MPLTPAPRDIKPLKAVPASQVNVMTMEDEEFSSDDGQVRDGYGAVCMCLCWGCVCVCGGGGGEKEIGGRVMLVYMCVVCEKDKN